MDEMIKDLNILFASLAEQLELIAEQVTELAERAQKLSEDI